MSAASVVTCKSCQPSRPSRLMPLCRALHQPPSCCRRQQAVLRRSDTSSSQYPEPGRTNSQRMAAPDRRSWPVQPRKKALRMRALRPLLRESSSWCLPVVARSVLNTGQMEPTDKSSGDNGFVFCLTGRRLQSFRPRSSFAPCPAVVFGALLHLYGRDWPLSIVPPDGDSQAVKLIQPDILDRAGFSVGENDGFSDERRLCVPERGEDRRGVELHNCHGVPQSAGRANWRDRVAFEWCGSRGRDTASECREDASVERLLWIRTQSR